MRITRIKVLTSHAAHARLNAELDDEPLGEIQRAAVSIPSPYSYSQTWVLYSWHGRAVFTAETRHKRYEVFEVTDPDYVVEAPDGIITLAR